MIELCFAPQGVLDQQQIVTGGKVVLPSRGSFSAMLDNKFAKNCKFFFRLQKGKVMKMEMNFSFFFFFLDCRDFMHRIQGSGKETFLLLS